jgi:hypothetical protein
MVGRLAITWICFATIMGFALGGTLVTSLQAPNAAVHHQDTPAKETRGKDHSAEVALAAYTWWLTFFTGMLALATVGLGIATVGLYLTGEKQIEVAQKTAEAAELSALASINVELPRFVLDEVILPHLGIYPREALKSPNIGLRFTNHGRTAAVVTLEIFDWKVAEKLPDDMAVVRNRMRRADLGKIVEPGAQYLLQRRFTVKLSDDEIERVLKGPEHLWLYGVVWYRDFLDERHGQAFCVRLQTDWSLDRSRILSVRFVESGPTSYRRRYDNPRRSGQTYRSFLSE